MGKIMLVDDNDFDNFFHTKVIKKFDPGIEVLIYDAPAPALQYLCNCSSDELPDHLFLDINMPDINGWDFIEEMKRKSFHFNGRTTITILTTSENPDDIHKAAGIKEINHFKTKPLSVQFLEQILN